MRTLGMDRRKLYTIMGVLAVCGAMRDFFHEAYRETSHERPRSLKGDGCVFHTSSSQHEHENPVRKFAELQSAGNELRLSPLNTEIRVSIPADGKNSASPQAYDSLCAVSSLLPACGSQGFNSHLQGVGQINREVSPRPSSDIPLLKRPKTVESFSDFQAPTATQVDSKIETLDLLSRFGVPSTSETSASNDPEYHSCIPLSQGGNESTRMLIQNTHKAPSSDSYHQDGVSEARRYDEHEGKVIQDHTTPNQPKDIQYLGFRSQKMGSSGSLSASHKQKELERGRTSIPEVMELRRTEHKIPKLETSSDTLNGLPQLIKVEEGTQWLEFNTSLFWISLSGTDSIDVKSITELLQIERSSPPARIEMSFEQATYLFDHLLSSSKKEKNKLSLSPNKGRYHSSEILSESTQVVVNHHQLWLEFWERKTGMDLNYLGEKKHNKFKKMREGFPVFLFYVDMIDTILNVPLLDPSQSKYEHKSSVLRLAIEKYEEYRGSHELERAQASYAQGSRLSRKKFDAPLEPIVWHMLDFWIANSGRIELIELRESERTSRSQGFKRFFNTLFRLSIGLCTHQLQEIQIQSLN
ncbi:hypothetical protein PGT21_030539 [Puccinia graminis f. sp. tritici]|uniref:Uncharacterized protein n=1 Tax=Puccinia graminis f. sp. tritici TaxID=56615 RepID=A0A5B0PV92_PUCGR|nr:hypothetical protein PGTUg99_007904 [Puccinia graminis f. sp. tritici]KAA1104722.1 hypothetical protein PGT21_030539 [Puccinia graminis f. sp. tritici]